MIRWRVRTVLIALAVLGGAVGCQQAGTVDDDRSPDTADTTDTADSPDTAGAATEATDADPAPAGPRALTADGWGPLRIGMTRAEVVAAVGEDANPDAVGGPEPEVCDEWRPARAPADMMVMLVRGRLARITLLDGSEVKTASGFGPGDEAADVEAAHPDAAVGPHKYLDAPASYIMVWATDPEGPDARGIKYETGLDGTVTHVHAGGPAIQYVEGCL